MNRWIESLRTLKESGEPAMLVTVMDVRGSAPRECGAKMLVTKTDLIGTIGGGQLEYQCARMAAERLEADRQAGNHSASVSGDNATFVQRFALGSNCGQCCGGVVEVLFETVTNAAWVPDLLARYDERVPVVIATALPMEGQALKFLVTDAGCRQYGPSPSEWQNAVTNAAGKMLCEPSSCATRLRLQAPKPFSLLLEPVRSSSVNLALFGAGHVGSAVIAVISGLDCNIRWIDSRRDIFPANVPANVDCLESATPAKEVAAMPPAAFYLIMTHSHALDFDICSEVLARGDFAYCGLIGSVSKRRRFEKLMRKQGMPDTVLDRLTCPIGVAGIDSKKPQAIAIAVAAEFLRAQATAGVVGSESAHNVHVLHR